MNSFGETLKRVSDSRRLQCSPVCYILPLLKQYMDAEITALQLYNQFRSQTRDAQFFFRHMPREHISENKRLFQNEFSFADELWSVLSAGYMDNDAVFKARILVCMNRYLASASASES